MFNYNFIPSQLKAEISKALKVNLRQGQQKVLMIEWY